MTEPNDTQKTKILQASIDELRRFYDHVSNIYDQLRLKALALIAGEVAIASFIFSSPNTNHIPSGSALRIFYFSGLILMGLAFALLLWTISSFDWKIPHDLYDSGSLYKKFEDEKAFLEYLHDDFIVAINHCLPAVNRKTKRFNWTIYLLAVGVIILLVIKYGG